MLLSSENSDESSYPLTIRSHGLQTLMEPDCPNGAPESVEVHLASKIWPHVPRKIRQPGPLSQYMPKP